MNRFESFSEIELKYLYTAMETTPSFNSCRKKLMKEIKKALNKKLDAVYNAYMGSISNDFGE